MNSFNGVGRLTKEPEMRFIPGSGMATTTFTLAIDRNMAKDKKQQAEAQGKPTADFIRVVTWGKTAENCANFLAKGRLCAVMGSVQTNSYKTAQGETRYSTDINAERVEFLEWGNKKAEEQTSHSQFEELPEDSEDFIPF